MESIQVEVPSFGTDTFQPSSVIAPKNVNVMNNIPFQLALSKVLTSERGDAVRRRSEEADNKFRGTKIIGKNNQFDSISAVGDGVRVDYEIPTTDNYTEYSSFLNDPTYNNYDNYDFSRSAPISSYTREVQEDLDLSYEGLKSENLDLDYVLSCEKEDEDVLALEKLEDSEVEEDVAIDAVDRDSIHSLLREAEEENMLMEAEKNKLAEKEQWEEGDEEAELEEIEPINLEGFRFGSDRLYSKMRMDEAAAAEFERLQAIEMKAEQQRKTYQTQLLNHMFPPKQKPSTIRRWDPTPYAENPKFYAYGKWWDSIEDYQQARKSGELHKYTLWNYENGELKARRRRSKPRKKSEKEALTFEESLPVNVIPMKSTSSTVSRKNSKLRGFSKPVDVHQSELKDYFKSKNNVMSRSANRGSLIKQQRKKEKNAASILRTTEWNEMLLRQEEMEKKLAQKTKNHFMFKNPFRKTKSDIKLMI